MIAGLILSTFCLSPLGSSDAVAVTELMGPGRASEPATGIAPAGQAADEPAKFKPDGNKLVKVALLADRASLRPGETCTLAVKLTIEPTWHVYWQNPGDAGMPTKVEVQAPPGFAVGPVRYPVPQREESEGDILSYVYTGEVVFLVDVKAPADLAPPARDSSAPGAKIELGVACRWLVCTEICVQGKGAAKIALALAPAADPARLANEKEFAAWRAKLPLPYDELFAIEGFHSSELTDWKKPFVVAVPGASELDFYPYVEDPISLAVSTLQLASTGKGTSMKIQFEPPAGYEGPRYGFSGLIAVRTAQGRAYYEIAQSYGATVEPLAPGGTSGTKSPPKK